MEKKINKTGLTQMQLLLSDKERIDKLKTHPRQAGREVIEKVLDYFERNKPVEVVEG